MAGYKRTAARLTAWIVFQDESGCALRPPKARTWSRRGHTPQVRVSAKGSGRVNLAGMIAVRPGCRTRLIYRVLVYHRRRGEQKGFRERDLAGMLDAARQQLGRTNIVLVWDNDTNHRDSTMTTLIAERPWLTVFYLPAYTPTLNPVEGVWSVLKRSLANLAPHGVDALAALAKTRLRRMQYRHDGVLDGFIAETGLDLDLDLDLEPPKNVSFSSSVSAAPWNPEMTGKRGNCSARLPECVTLACTMRVTPPPRCYLSKA